MLRKWASVVLISLWVTLLYTQLLRAQGAVETALHTFSGSDGSVPYALIQAADGNFYGTAVAGGTGSCGSDPGKSDNVVIGCGTIFQVTPTGDTQVIHNFAGLSDGAEPTSLIQGGDGNLYGTTAVGGSGLCDTDPGVADDVVIGCGTIFEITLGGAFNNLYSFQNMSDGAYPNGLIQAANGSFYGGAVTGGHGFGVLFQIALPASPATPAILWAFTGNADGAYPYALVQGADGNLYGTTQYGGDLTACIGYGCGTVFSVPTSGGQPTNLHIFEDGTDGANFKGVRPRILIRQPGRGEHMNFDVQPIYLLGKALAQGVDGYFYGTTPSLSLYTREASLTTSSTAFRITPSQTWTLLYPFTGNSDGGGSFLGLFPGSDNNFYGSSGDDIFRLSYNRDFGVVYTFKEGTDGGSPYALLQDNFGNFLGTAQTGGNLNACTQNPAAIDPGPGCGTIFKITPSPALIGPVQLALSSGSVTIGSPVTLSWSVSNAFSATMQQCYAFVQGGATTAGNWSGLQPGTLTGSLYSGSATLTPTAGGTYTYALTCGGVESGFATLTVPPLTITTTALPSGSVGAPYSFDLSASGGLAPYTWSILLGAPSANISLQPNGVLSGSPTQTGVTTFIVQVTDSELVPATTNTPLTLSIGTAGLTLSPAELTFASTGGTSPPQVVTLQNSGNAPLTLFSRAISSEFAETDNCGTTLAAGANCVITVTFTPAGPGLQSGALTISDNEVGSPQTVILYGSQTGLQFVPIPPCRVADTRNPAGPFGGPALDGMQIRNFVVPQSTCGVPSTAAAYALNVTVVPGGPLGYLSVWPAGQSQPSVSLLNSDDGRVKANAAIIPAGTSGAISVFPNAETPTHVVIDMSGYFVPATSSSLQFYPLTPCRVADTRNPVGPYGGPSLTGGQSRAFPVQASDCQVPATAEAYSLNITAVPPGGLGYLTIWPTGQPQPTVSTLNAGVQKGHRKRRDCSRGR